MAFLTRKQRHVLLLRLKSTVKGNAARRILDKAEKALLREWIGQINFTIGL